MKPLDHTLRTQLIPALTGRSPPNDIEATLFSMPVRNGGLGIRFPSTISDIEFHSSTLITSPLCAHIASQDPSYGPNIAGLQIKAKAEVRKINRVRVDNHLHRLLDTLPETLKGAVKLAQEKGSSTWLTALPLTEHGFTLHKSAFQDAMALRYGWTPKDLPSTCSCGSKFSVEHALSCPKGGFPTIRHNEIRDLSHPPNRSVQERLHRTNPTTRPRGPFKRGLRQSTTWC